MNIDNKTTYHILKEEDLTDITPLREGLMIYKEGTQWGRIIVSRNGNEYLLQVFLPGTSIIETERIFRTLRAAQKYAETGIYDSREKDITLLLITKVILVLLMVLLIYLKEYL